MSHRRVMYSKALASYVVPAGICASLVSVAVRAFCLQKCVNLSKGNTETAYRNCDAQNSVEQQKHRLKPKVSVNYP